MALLHWQDAEWFQQDFFVTLECRRNGILFPLVVLVEDVDPVDWLEAGFLSQLVDSRSERTEKSGSLEIGMSLNVENDNDFVVRGVFVCVALGGVDVSRDNKITGNEFNTGTCDFAGQDIILAVLRGQVGQAFLDLGKILAELLTQSGPVGGGTVFDTNGRFVRRIDHVDNVELGGNIVFERFDVVEVFLVVMEDDELLERHLLISGFGTATHLGLEVVLVSDSTTKLNDSLEALDLSLNDCVKVLFSDSRERQEVDGSSVQGGVCWRRCGGEKGLVNGFRGEGGEGGL